MPKTIIEECVKQGIRDNPEAAAREIPQIIDYYVTDNTKLNRLYQAVGSFLASPNLFSMATLRHAYRECRK